VIAAGSVAAAVLGAGPAGAAPSSTDVTGDRPATATAVEVFTVPAAIPDQLSDDVAQALETAEVRAEADPADLAPPYVDRATGRIVAGVRADAESTKVAYAAAGRLPRSPSGSPSSRGCSTRVRRRPSTASLTWTP
jgi:hypothetical protein